jgi:hypothetical protein
VRGSFFAGEDFADLAEAQRRAESWCREVAGQRVHSTTCARPAQVFAAAEAPRLLPAPEGGYDLPRYSRPKVHPDRHVEVDRALYSVPGELVGQRLSARADASTVKLYHRGHLIKVHPRVAPGPRRTDAADLPAERAVYTLRDVATLHDVATLRDVAALRERAAEHGPALGAHADALLEHPLPWTRTRQVYRLLGLVHRHGAERVDEACRRALDTEAVNVGLIGRMLKRGTENREPGPPAAPGTPAVRPRRRRGRGWRAPMTTAAPTRWRDGIETASPARTRVGPVWTPVVRPVRRQASCPPARRQNAWRRRDQPGPTPAAIPAPRPRRPVTVDACPWCATGDHGDQRCPPCTTRSARVGMGGLCPHGELCPHRDEPAALADLRPAPNLTAAPAVSADARPASRCRRCTSPPSSRRCCAGSSHRPHPPQPGRPRCRRAALNGRPRKTLDRKTPAEALAESRWRRRTSAVQPVRAEVAVDEVGRSPGATRWWSAMSRATLFSLTRHPSSRRSARMRGDPYILRCPGNSVAPHSPSAARRGRRSEVAALAAWRTRPARSAAPDRRPREEGVLARSAQR